MQLSPLQSRLAASVIATCLLIALYFTLFSPHFALAAELKQTTLPILLNELVDVDVELDVGEEPTATDAPAAGGAGGSLRRDPTYEPDFAAFGRSIIGRAPAGVRGLENNVEINLNVVSGQTEVFVLESSKREEERDGERLELRDVWEEELRERGPGKALEMDMVQGLQRRQSSRTVYISANMCRKPERRRTSNTAQEPPQLTLYVSTDRDNESPGPNADSSSQTVLKFKEGAVMFNVTTAEDVFIGVHASNVSSTDFEGDYNFNIAASTDTYFHSYIVDREPDLIWVDSDSQGALLITRNLTDSPDVVVQDRIMQTQPYVMFAQNRQDKSINGVRHSYCGLQNYAQIAAMQNGKFSNMVQTVMTKRGPGNLPKQQFYFSGLNSSADYIGFLAQDGNLTNVGNGRPGGGGHVYRATSFSTKSNHGNCAIIQNLTFCDQIAYSVPSNPSFGNASKLADFYDSYASSVYGNFQKALAQVPCEAPNAQRYSLVRDCDDCAAAYKDWLCSVAIPRCEDFSNSTDAYHPRALSQPFPNGDLLDRQALADFPNTTAYNSSRNPRIDDMIRPGPYKEVLPCDDLCYTLVQSCPSSLGFSCPRPGDAGFNSSYATRVNGRLTCNYPGSAHLFSGAPGRWGGGGGLLRPWVLGISLGASLMMIAVL